MIQMALRWTMGVVAIAITIWVANLLGVPLTWEPPWRVIIFVPVLAIINAVIGPIIKLLALPINCLTFGLFSFIVNALLFWLAGHLTGAHMNIWGALLGSIMYAALSTVLSWPIKEK